MIRTFLLALAALLLPAPALAQDIVSGLNPSAGGGSAVDPSVNFIATRWYAPQGISTAAYAGSANSLRMTTFVIPAGKTITISDMQVYVAAASAGGSVQLVIYAIDTSTNLPSGAPVAACTISTAATGYITCPLASGTGVLPPGIYYAGGLPDTNGATATLLGISQSSGNLSRMVGVPNAQANVLLFANQTLTGCNVTVTFTSGSYPSSPGCTPAGNGAPTIGFKVSAVS